MHPWMRRAQRIKQEQQDRTTDIANFLAWCSDEELWLLTPMLHTLLPPPLRQDFSLLDSDAHLRLLYDSWENVNFVPMLSGLLRRWQIEQPEKVSALIGEITEFLRHQRAQ